MCLKLNCVFADQGEDQKKREEQEKEKEKEKLTEAAALEAKKLEKDTNKHMMKQKSVKVNEDICRCENDDPNDVKNNKEKGRITLGDRYCCGHPK